MIRPQTPDDDPHHPLVANKSKYICGKVRRELLVETLHIYPPSITVLWKQANIAAAL